MSLLYTNKKPLKNKNRADKFEDFIAQSLFKCSKAKIAVGYVSIDSLKFLSDNLDKISNIEIIIGMPGQEGFVKSQFEYLKEFNKKLTKSKKGSIFVVNAFKYHGKFYLFEYDDGKKNGSVGSSNLENILPEKSKSIEMDIFLEEKEHLEELEIYFNDLKTNASMHLDEISNPKFKENGEPIDLGNNTERLSHRKHGQLWRPDGKNFFELEIKCEKSSNINVAFASPRRNNSTGIGKKRPWYEAEIIVSQSLIKKPGYPRGKSFTVITDDGKRFKCQTDKSSGKNLTSEGDLQILGKWIKGRLENEEILKIGEMVTPEMLKKYGRNTVTLSSTAKDDVWLLDFGVEKL